MSKFGEWRGILTMQMTDKEYVSTCSRTLQGHARHTGLQIRPSDGPHLLCPSALRPTWRPSWVFHCTTRRLIHWSVWGLRFAGVWGLRFAQDDCLVQVVTVPTHSDQKRVRSAMGTKGSARTRMTQATETAAGWSTRMYHLTLTSCSRRALNDLVLTNFIETNIWKSDTLPYPNLYRDIPGWPYMWPIPGYPCICRDRKVVLGYARIGFL